MHDVIDSLTKVFPSLSPQLRRAAAVVMDDPSSIAVESMRATAARAEVSPPTMLRLAQRVGFPNYETFRDVFKQSVMRGGYGDRAGDLQKSIGKEGIVGLVSETAASAMHGIERFSDPVFWRDVDLVAGLIARAKRTFVVASGASFGQAVSFHYVCRMALPSMELAPGFGVRAVDGLASAGADDLILAITTSPYATQTVEATSFAQQRGVPVAAVTDRRTSPIAVLSEATILIDTQSPHYFPSMITLNATLEILSAAVAVKRGREAVAAISDYEAALKSSGYYWEEGRG